jgi:predicted metal-dependent phosphoesterase TrpH
MLGYFFDANDDDLAAFLISQRALRVSRVREIAGLLAGLDMPIDIENLLMEAATRPGSSVGRPQIARALVLAGYVPSVQDAFDVWLASGRPAYVPRSGPSPADVVNAIHDARGLASFAHPGVTERDDLIEPLVQAGLDAIEVYHSDHSPEETAQYRRMAARLKVLVTGGSDFHGEDPDKPEPSFAEAPEGWRRRSTLGTIVLPKTYFAALESRATNVPARD